MVPLVRLCTVVIQLEITMTDQTLCDRFLDEAAIWNTVACFADSFTRSDVEMFRSV